MVIVGGNTSRQREASHRACLLAAAASGVTGIAAS